MDECQDTMDECQGNHVEYQDTMDCARATARVRPYYTTVQVIHGRRV